MKQFLVVMTAIAMVSAAAPAAVFAHTDGSVVEIEAGILPTSQFYFLKGWGNAIKRIFTFNSLRKVKLELDIADVKIAELEKLEEVSPNNIDAFSRSLKKYEKAAGRLKSQLKSLPKDDLLDDLADRSLKHQQFFDDLRVKFEFQSDFKAELDRAQEILTEIMIDIPAENFELAVKNQTSDWKELRAAEVLDRLAEKLDSEKKESILKLKEDLLIKFSGRLEGQSFLSAEEALLPDLERIPGDQLRRLRILDEVRENIVNPDLKSQLNVIRQRILENAQAAGAINSKKAEEAIAMAEKLLSEVEKIVAEKEGGISRSASQLTDRGKFNLGQAKELFKQSNFGGAYGQATAAVAAFKNVLTQFSDSAEDWNDALIRLKKEFDAYLSEADGLGLIKEKNPKLFELFSEAERKIADLSKSLDSKPNSDKIISSVKSIKLILATIDQLLESAK